MSWWLPLALAIPVYFAWAFVHEGSHALAAMAAGCKVTSFKPWPHKVDGKGWYFGRVTYDEPPPMVSKLAPYITDLVAFPAFAVPLFYVGNDWAWFVLVTLAAAPPVNTGTAVMGRLHLKESTDLWELHWAWSWVAFLLVVAYAMVGSAAIVVRIT